MDTCFVKKWTVQSHTSPKGYINLYHYFIYLLSDSGEIWWNVPERNAIECVSFVKIAAGKVVLFLWATHL